MIASFALTGCSRPAELDTAEGHRIVDAFYTAVTSKKIDLLDHCDVRLASLKADALVSESAYRELMAISAKARGGDWQPAAEQLDWFIRNQRPDSH